MKGVEGEGEPWEWDVALVERVQYWESTRALRLDVNTFLEPKANR